MTKIFQQDYFDKTGKKLFTYYTEDDDPYFYDDDANACSTWVKAHVPLKSNESPKNIFHRMLLSHELFTKRQLKEVLREQNRAERTVSVKGVKLVATKKRGSRVYLLTRGEPGLVRE